VPAGWLAGSTSTGEERLGAAAVGGEEPEGLPAVAVLEGIDDLLVLGEDLGGPA
jgi:hypothetical protein